ncbi:hypothetical protein F5883DRAFT_221782 [Diaporthe sp. PMI_573]|nr:hypothetical protein F5883DRAFT_221782 [Diaporthaceae sp. PMI_573]
MSLSLGSAQPARVVVLLLLVPLAPACKSSRPSISIQRLSPPAHVTYAPCRPVSCVVFLFFLSSEPTLSLTCPSLPVPRPQPGRSLLPSFAPVPRPEGPLRKKSLQQKGRQPRP